MAAVDVLIPAYNAATTIERAVASILGQTMADFRIIAIDDGSSDQTGSILDAMAASDARLQMVRTSNRGLVNALNTGLERVDAPLVARHDADDLAFADRFAMQLAYLDGHPDCVAVGANAWHIDEQGTRLGSQTPFGGDVAPDAGAIPSKEPYLLHPFLMVRSEALRRVGGYRHCIHSEDTDLYWRLLGAGRLHNLADILGEYRVHQNSVSSASVLNGRIMAVSSQLAAVSYRRRLAGRADLPFPPDGLERFQQAGSLAAITATAGEALDDNERDWLEIAASAKLLHLASYRPYQLEPADCQTIGRMLGRHAMRIPAHDKRRIRAMLDGNILKLARSGRKVDALTLGLAGALSRRAGSLLRDRIGL
jgi:GT2 family glycosyltransferase